MTARANRSSDIAGIAIRICPSRKLRLGLVSPDLRAVFMGERLSDRPAFANDASPQRFNRRTPFQAMTNIKRRNCGKTAPILHPWLTMISVASQDVTGYEPDMMMPPRPLRLAALAAVTI